ncbi:MAG: hypothetical protein KKC01_11850 [Gammaproteobacteria bacterium]|nr:hypothetical protein [Gammaproteobacteria bacterium]
MITFSYRKSGKIDVWGGMAAGNWQNTFREKYMLKRNRDLHLDHCHHCGIDEPGMMLVSSFVTNNQRQDAPREWCIHHCESCGGAVLSGAIAGSGVISEIYPAAISGQAVSQQEHAAEDGTGNLRTVRESDAGSDKNLIRAYH